MVSLLQCFREFGNVDAPSMRQRMEPSRYQGMDEIVQYLRNGGKETGISAKPSVDCFTGKRIPNGYSTFYNDGEYSWKDVLIYYIEQYNLRLPDEFVKHVHSKMNNH